MTDPTAEQLFRAAVEGYPDSTAHKALADRLEELDRPRTAALVRRAGIFGDGCGGGGFGDGGGGFGDGGYGGDGYGGYGGDGYGGDGGGGGDGDDLKADFSEGLIVEDGFYLITVRGGYYPFVFACWLERRDDFVHLLNSRVIRRFGSRAQLAVLAKKGPQADTELLDLSPEEWVPVFSVGRVLPADPTAWKKECPRPKEFAVTAAAG